MMFQSIELTEYTLILQGLGLTRLGSMCLYPRPLDGSCMLVALNSRHGQDLQLRVLEAELCVARYPLASHDDYRGGGKQNCALDVIM